MKQLLVSMFYLWVNQIIYGVSKEFKVGRHPGLMHTLFGFGFPMLALSALPFCALEFPGFVLALIVSFQSTNGYVYSFACFSSLVICLQDHLSYSGMVHVGRTTIGS